LLWWLKIITTRIRILPACHANSDFETGRLLLPVFSSILGAHLLMESHMANRLSKIATRTGDDGTTGLGDGSRTEKDALRVHAMGDVDELNSHFGLLLCETLPDALREELISIQHDLFDMGGELCIPGFAMITETHVARLDRLLAKYNADLPSLQDFILPAGSRAAAQAHVCRTVCRRAERAIVSLGRAEAVHDHPRQYMNRLSDLLFVLSRVLNRFGGRADVLWQKGRLRD
jgi:cob(I)alamin adenosyltransferase